MRLCPKCHTDNSDDAQYCHMCGAELSTYKNKSNVFILILFLLLVLVGLGIYVYRNSCISDSSSSAVSVSTSKLQAKKTIDELNSAVQSNNYNRLEKLYALIVERYHNKYNICNKEVVDLYKKYDSKFGVYNKSITVRWDTFQCHKNDNGTFDVTYVIDYHIDRYDKSKYTDFVLRKNITMDDSFKIISEYDVTLSKSK